MASVVNRTTFEFLASVNTPLFPDPPWKVNPDMSQVVGVPTYFQKWDAVNDRPIPMTAGEQATVTASRLSTARDATAAQLTSTENIIRALVLLIMDEFNLHSTKESEELADIAAATSLADYKTRRGIRSAVPQRTAQQLIDAIRQKLGT